MLAALILLCVAVAFLWVRRLRRPHNFPPGPVPSLLLGNIEVAREIWKGNFAEVLKQNHKKFGSIVGFVFPNGDTMVNVSKFEDINDLCSKPEFQGRSNQFTIQFYRFFDKLGIIFNDGPAWLEHRRFALRHLRDLGFGRTSMESLILEEFDELAKDMDAAQGKPMKVNNRFNLTALNILWKLVASTRLKSSSPEAQQHVEDLNEFLARFNIRSPLNTASWLRFIFPQWTGYNFLWDYRKKMFDMMQTIMQEHRENLDPSHPRDFVDLFLLEMRAPDAEKRLFTDKNLSLLGTDFFIAGMETTATSLSWALLFMVMYPKVQRRVQKEIDDINGEAHPTNSDRLRLPYTEAVAMEITRRATVLPSGVARRAMSDSSLGGYFIPRDTVLLQRLEAVHMDPEYWGDPEAFRPERFLNANGTIRKDDHLIPFGVGKRVCLGQNLARMELFMLFACLMQRYTFEVVPGQVLSMDSNALPIKKPMEFSVTYSRRGVGTG